MKPIAPGISVRVLIPAGALAASVVLFVFGMLQKPYTAYAFPGLFVAAMIFFSLAWTIEEIVFAQESTAERTNWGAVAFGILLIILYLSAVQLIGFRWSSLLTFAIIGVGYSPTRKSIKNVAIAILSAVLFMLVIYGLFDMLLKVQVPTGVF